MLKNYTSGIAVERSVAMIEQLLAARGATKIMKTYDAKGLPIGMLFSIPIGGQEVHFRLPSRIENCRTILERSLSPRARPETKKNLLNQAGRTAWKILFDWCEAQMAMIDLAQVDVCEVFMAYLYDAAQDKTLFDHMKERGFKAMIGDGK